jgi:hypothetical protein
MERKYLSKSTRKAIVIAEVLIIASLFFLVTSFVGLALFLLSEISLVEVSEYLMVATTWESISIITFLRGLMWVFFKRRWNDRGVD